MSTPTNERRTAAVDLTSAILDAAERANLCPGEMVAATLTAIVLVYAGERADKLIASHALTNITRDLLDAIDQAIATVH